MYAHASPFVVPRLEPDARVLVNQVPWSTYVTMRDLLDEAGSGVRLTYLERTLEIMSPSHDHELLKTLLARLREAWADETGVDLEGIGSTTFRKEAEERVSSPTNATASASCASCRTLRSMWWSRAGSWTSSMSMRGWGSPRSGC